MLDRKPSTIAEKLSSFFRKKEIPLRVDFYFPDKKQDDISKELKRAYTPQEMQSLLESGVFPEHTHIQITDNDRGHYEHLRRHRKLEKEEKAKLDEINYSLNKMIKALVKGIQKGNCKDHLGISFEHVSIGDKGAKQLAKLLKSRLYPKNFGLFLFRTKIGDEGALALANAMKQESQLAKLDLSMNTMGDKGIEAIIGAIPFAPTNFYLNLSSMIQVQDHHLKKLAEMLQSKTAPKHFHGVLSLSAISSIGFGYLCSALKSGLCQSHLHFALHSVPIDDSCMKELADVFESGKCPSHLYLSFMRVGFTDAGALSLARGLRSRKAPSNLSIFVYGETYISIEGHRAIAESLASGYWPNELFLAFELPKGQEMIALQFYLNAIETGNAPRGLHLHFNCSELGPDAEKMIVKTIKTGKCPPGFNITKAYPYFSSVEKLLDETEAELKSNSYGCYLFEKDANKSKTKTSNLPRFIRREIYQYLIPACNTQTQAIFFKNIGRLNNESKNKPAEKQTTVAALSISRRTK